MTKGTETEMAPKGGINVGAVAAFGMALAIVVGYAFGLHGSDFGVEDWRSAGLMALVIAIPFLLLSLLGLLLWLGAAALIILLMGMIISDDAFFVETIDRTRAFGNGVCGLTRLVIVEQKWIESETPKKYVAWMCPDDAPGDGSETPDTEGPDDNAPAPTEDPATGGAASEASE